jgi:recombination protein RecA
MSIKKIVLSNSQIGKIKKYYEQGFNRSDIALKLGISEWAVRKELRGNCRAAGQSLRLFHERNTLPLTYEQEQLILGSLLGDASLSYRQEQGAYDFQVGHCLGQKELLEYKANILGTKVRSYIKDENSYSAGKEFFITSYYNKYELDRIYKICFSDGIKTVSEEWVSAVNEMAIAIWFMDDGTSSYIQNSVMARFSTLSFTKEQLEILQRRLEDFDVDTTLQKHADGTGLVIAIRQSSVNKFMDLIDPYIVDCMKYKIKRRTNEPNYRFRAKNIRSKGRIL